MCSKTYCFTCNTYVFCKYKNSCSPTSNKTSSQTSVLQQEYFRVKQRGGINGPSRQTDVIRERSPQSRGHYQSKVWDHLLILFQFFLPHFRIILNPSNLWNNTTVTVGIIMSPKESKIHELLASSKQQPFDQNSQNRTLGILSSISLRS